MYQPVGEGVRRAVARNFPFSIYFRIHEKEIFAFHVFHGRCNPLFWKAGLEDVATVLRVVLRRKLTVPATSRDGWRLQITCY